MRSMLRTFAAALLLSSVACARWQATQMPSTVTGSEIHHARVVMHDGTWVAVDELINQGDSLWGLIPHSARPGAPLARFAADTSQVAQVLVKRIDFGRVGAIFVIPVVLVGSSYFLLDF